METGVYFVRYQCADSSTIYVDTLATGSVHTLTLRQHPIYKYMQAQQIAYAYNTK